MSALADIEHTLQDAAARYGPAVVGLGRGWGPGCGVVISPGRVLAVAHGLRERETTVVFPDGSRRDGTVLATDVDLGLAVVEVPTGEVAAVRWTDGREPTVGQPVVALANPGGRGLRVTFGFISSVGRSFRGPRGRRMAGAIEHTAPLPRGSSGSPLLDTTGRLLGLNAVRADGGLILAVHADTRLRERIEALAQGETPQRPWLGVAVAPPRVARELRRAVGLPERGGLLVRAVHDSSPAAEATLRRGDLIVSFAGRPVARIDELHEAMAAVEPGRPTEVAVVRGDDELTLTVRLEENGGDGGS